MAIKDNITLGLKYAMMNSIDKTKESGNEHGFLMCKNKDGKWSASGRNCEGDSCGMDIDIYPELCPDKKIQGFFHVHPELSEQEERLGRKLTKEDIKNAVVRDKKGNIIELQTPSYADVLTILLTKCEKSTEGTICTASDLVPDNVGCWTPRTGSANFATCYYAKRENILTKNKDIEPKRWIRPLFNKEIIELKNIH
jgi:hypothetical protein